MLAKRIITNEGVIKYKEVTGLDFVNELFGMNWMAQNCSNFSLNGKGVSTVILIEK